MGTAGVSGCAAFLPFTTDTLDIRWDDLRKTVEFIPRTFLKVGRIGRSGTSHANSQNFVELTLGLVEHLRLTNKFPSHGD